MQRASRRLTPCGGQPVFNITKPLCSPARSSKPPFRPSSTPSRRPASQCRRCYATERPPPPPPPPSSSSSSSSLETSRHSADEDLSWPTTNPNNPYEIPTPYQIFKMSPGDTYSKKRFYALVKLYHPDRTQHANPSSNSSPELSAAAKLQRYRMVIAANELLSDPRRRRLYDTHHLGWSGRPEFGPTRPAWEYYDAAKNEKKPWTGFQDNASPNDPRANATWEDWEAWQMRNERTHGEQRPVYASNATFVVLICVAAGVAASFEGARAGERSRSMLEQVDARHARNSRDLMRRREESAGFDDRDERTRRFLRVRGPVAKELEMAAVGQEREGTVFVPDEEEPGEMGSNRRR